MESRYIVKPRTTIEISHFDYRVGFYKGTSILGNYQYGELYRDNESMLYKYTYSFKSAFIHALWLAEEKL